MASTEKSATLFASGKRRKTTGDDGDEAERGGGSLVSVIMPCHNAATWLPEALHSVLHQSHRPLELSFWDDSSTDGSGDLVCCDEWLQKFRNADVTVIIGRTPDSDGSAGAPKGAGYAKNMAVQNSRGAYLAFLDSDDIADPHRIEQQLACIGRHPEASRVLVGANFRREPPGATPRYTEQLNALTNEQLMLQR